MNFTFETEYNQKAIKNMAYLMRKSMKRKKNRRTNIMGWIVVAIVILLSLPVIKGEAEIDISTIITWITGIVVTVVLLFQDSINGFLSRRVMLSGTNKAVANFNYENYISETAAGKTEFKYDRIAMVAENEDYFAFFLDKRYAQIYDKNNISGGTIDEFRKFITDKTGKEVVICDRRRNVK